MKKLFNVLLYVVIRWIVKIFLGVVRYYGIKFFVKKKIKFWIFDLEFCIIMIYF